MGKHRGQYETRLGNTPRARQRQRFLRSLEHTKSIKNKTPPPERMTPTSLSTTRPLKTHTQACSACCCHIVDRSYALHVTPQPSTEHKILHLLIFFSRHKSYSLYVLFFFFVIPTLGCIRERLKNDDATAWRYHGDDAHGVTNSCKHE